MLGLAQAAGSRFDGEPGGGPGDGPPCLDADSLGEVEIVDLVDDSEAAAVAERASHGGHVEDADWEAQRFFELTLELADAIEPESVGRILLSFLASTCDVVRSAIFVGFHDEPRLLSCRGLDDAIVMDFQVKAGSVLTEAHGQSSPVPIPRLDPDVDPWLSAVLPGARDLYIVPMTAGESRAVLVTEIAGGSESRRLAERIVQRFAALGARALRNTTRYQRLVRLASTDGLTGLANRRTFDEVLDRELARARRSDGRLSIVLIDIDRFKQLNDTYGHLAGDDVLRGLGKALRSCARDYDTVTRFGGEEFAAILPGCSSRLALQVAERLRHSVETADTIIPVTVSCGIATYPGDGLEPRSLVAAADAALYASKHSGRNAVSLAEWTRSAS